MVAGRHTAHGFTEFGIKHEWVPTLSTDFWVKAAGALLRLYK